MSRWPIASPAWWPIWSTLPAACWWVPSTRAPTACARQRKTCARRSAWPKAVPLIAPPAPTAAGRDARAALAAWEVACKHLSDPAIGLVVLDEMTYAFKYGWLDLDTVIAKLLSRPLMQHVIITGRAAPEALREVADTVSDIGMEKHAFQSGIKAMPGLEF